MATEAQKKALDDIAAALDAEYTRQNRREAIWAVFGCIIGFVTAITMYVVLWHGGVIRLMVENDLNRQGVICRPWVPLD